MNEVVATYDFDEDAAGLTAFVGDMLAQIGEDESPVVYVEDGDAKSAYRADWIKQTLTDGSVAYTLRLWFVEQGV